MRVPGIRSAGLGALVASLVAAAPAAAGEIAVQNLDGVPFPDRLVMSRMENPKGLPHHDTSTVRVRNVGSSPLVVDDLSVSGPFALASPPSLPATVAPGGGLDVTVRFTATGAGPSLRTGRLDIHSDDSDEAVLPVQLAGLWQAVPEGDTEPSLESIVAAFGYQTRIIDPGDTFKKQSRIVPAGEEVISPYWQRASTSKPVVVHQLAAYRNPGGTVFRWHARSTTDDPPSPVRYLLAHHTEDYQTVLPRHGMLEKGLAAGSFTPGGNPEIGFKVSNNWTDPTLNEIPFNCVAECGHSIRACPMRTRPASTSRSRSRRRSTSPSRGTRRTRAGSPSLRPAGPRSRSRWSCRTGARC
jgi:hypothetical protein